MVEKLGNETQVYLNLESADADVIYRQPDTLTIESGDKLSIGILHTVVTCSTAMVAHVVACAKEYGID